MGLTHLFVAHDPSMVKHISTGWRCFIWERWWELTTLGEIIYTTRFIPTRRRCFPLSRSRIRRSKRKGTRTKMPGGEAPSPINTKPGCRFREDATRCPVREQENAASTEIGKATGGPATAVYRETTVRQVLRSAHEQIKICLRIW